MLKRHAQEPIHLLVGGGDQIYCDAIAREPEITPWIDEEDMDKKMKSERKKIQYLDIGVEQLLSMHFDISSDSHPRDSLCYRQIRECRIYSCSASLANKTRLLQLFNHYVSAVYYFCLTSHSRCTYSLQSLYTIITDYLVPQWGFRQSHRNNPYGQHDG